MAETLQEILLDPAKRPQVVTDCQELLDAEVEDKNGVSGLAVKGTFAMVKKVKPGIIHDAVDGLLDDFVARLEPFYADFQAAGAAKPLPEHLTERGDEVSDALLGITDARAERSQRATIKKAYQKLRPQGKKHVEDALPRLGALIEKHTNA
ncbi:MAG: DUF6918 family protein [Sciscionella sp.]